MSVSLSLFRIPPEDEALRPKIRAFLDAEWGDAPAGRRAYSWMGYDASFSRRLAQAGFVGITLPVAYGGGGRSAFARFVVGEELLARGAPVSAHWIADRQSGPLILRYGTDEQRAFYLPRICRGEAFFCIGMSEPDSGSDLASIRTRAQRDGEGWRLNGRKIWTTHAHRSHYMIALVRTSGTPEQRQTGLSQLIVDLSLPGVSVRPIKDITGESHFNEVTFEDVWLPGSALIGAEGNGWTQVNAELAFERSGPERMLSSIALFDALLAWQRTRGDAGAHVLAEIGEIHARHVVLRSMSVAVTSLAARGENPLLAAAVVKDLGTRVEKDIATVAGRIAGDDPLHPPPVELLEALAYTTQAAPTYSLRGGTPEILRGMIARSMGLR